MFLKYSQYKYKYLLLYTIEEDNHNLNRDVEKYKYVQRVRRVLIYEKIKSEHLVNVKEFLLLIFRIQRHYSIMKPAMMYKLQLHEVPLVSFF